MCVYTYNNHVFAYMFHVIHKPAKPNVYNLYNDVWMCIYKYVCIYIYILMDVHLQTEDVVGLTCIGV